MSFILVPTDSYVGGSVSGKFFRPAAINCNCPACGRAASFGFSGCKIDTTLFTLIHLRKCSGCAEPIKFYGDFSQEIDEQNRYKLSLYVLATSGSHLEARDYSGLIPDALNRSFHGTVNSFNTENFPAATVMGRRTLEGIFKNLLPADRRGLALYKLIEEAEEVINFKEPLRRLADAIRSGGNLGAHFDEEKEPDAEMAREMIELLSYLIEYLYVLPGQIQQLEDRIGGAK